MADDGMHNDFLLLKVKCDSTPVNNTSWVMLNHQISCYGMCCILPVTPWDGKIFSYHRNTIRGKIGVIDFQDTYIKKARFFYIISTAIIYTTLATDPKVSSWDTYISSICLDPPGLF